VKLTESGNAKSEQLLVVPTESLIKRVGLEWIRTSKARLAFRYEISDLFQKLFMWPCNDWCAVVSVHMGEQIDVEISNNNSFHLMHA